MCKHKFYYRILLINSFLRIFLILRYRIYSDNPFYYDETTDRHYLYFYIALLADKWMRNLSISYFHKTYFTSINIIIGINCIYIDNIKNFRKMILSIYTSISFYMKMYYFKRQLYQNNLKKFFSNCYKTETSQDLL